MSFIIKKRRIWWVGAVALLYFFVFQPPIVPRVYYPIVEIVIFFAFIFLYPPAIRVFKKFQVELSLGLLILIFSVMRDAASADIVYADRFAVWFFQSLVLGVPVALLLLKHADSLRDSLPTPLAAAVALAAALTLTLYFSPAFDAWYRNVQIDEVYDRYSSFEVRYRAYGISENLTFTYGYLLGSFAGYFYLRADRKVIFIFPALLCLVGAGLNARVGFLAFFIFAIYGIVLEQKWKSSLLFLSGAWVTWAIVSSGGADSLSLQWSLEFFREISALLFGGSGSSAGGTLSVLFGDFIVWPETTAQWMFGNGGSLFGAYGKSSDVGYIIQLNYSGIFFLALILMFQVFTSWRILKCLGGRHWFTYYFVLSLVVLNTKGFLFAATPGGRLVFVLYTYFVLRSLPEVATNLRQMGSSDGKLGQAILFRGRGV